VKNPYMINEKFGTSGTFPWETPQLYNSCRDLNIRYKETVVLGKCSSPIDPIKPAGIAKTALSYPKECRRAQEVD